MDWPIHAPRAIHCENTLPGSTAAWRVGRSAHAARLHRWTGAERSKGTGGSMLRVGYLPEPDLACGWSASALSDRRTRTGQSRTGAMALRDERRQFGKSRDKLPG